MIIACGISLMFFILLGMLAIGGGLSMGVNEPTYELDPNQKDILPNLPTTRAGIPQFVELLREAKEIQDISICQTLPEPLQKRYRVSDYMENAPTLEHWKNYCEALVNDDSSICEKIPQRTFTNPNLNYECKSIFGS